MQDALNELMEGRTTLIIAHRLSTVRHADQIIVVQQGQVSGTGTHEQLIKTHEFYQELVLQQFE